MKRIAAFAIAATMMSFGANAQVAGRYWGTTSTGDIAWVDVAIDPNTSNPEVKDAGWGVTLACSKSMENLNVRHGVMYLDDGHDFVNGTFSDTFATADSYITFTIGAQLSNTLSGSVSLTMADFNPASGYSQPPTKAQTCGESGDTYSAQLTTSPSALPTDVVFEKVASHPKQINR